MTWNYPEGEERYACILCEQDVGDFGPEGNLCLDCSKQQPCENDGCYEFGPLAYCDERTCRTKLCTDCAPRCSEHQEAVA